MGWGKRDWEKLIRTIAADTSQVAWTFHAKQQMRQRHISMAMAIDVLQKGIIRLEPETDIKTGHTICRMERFCAGEKIAVCVALESRQARSCIVVTTMIIGA